MPKAIHADTALSIMAQVLAQDARLYPQVLHLLNLEQTTILERPTSEKVTTSGHTSPTERAALHSAHINNQRDDLKLHYTDALNTLKLFHERLTKEIADHHRRMGTSPTHATPTPCTGQGYEGRELAWTPHSRDPQNGWHDPLCKDLAITHNGKQLHLCFRCLQRHETWRRKHGHPPLTTQPAQSEAA